MILRQETATTRVNEPTKAGSPSQYNLDITGSLCLVCSCDDFSSNDQNSRQIANSVPCLRVAAPVHTLSVSRVWNAYKTGIGQNPVHALLMICETSPGRRGKGLREMATLSRARGTQNGPRFHPIAGGTKTTSRAKALDRWEDCAL